MSDHPLIRPGRAIERSRGTRRGRSSGATRAGDRDTVGIVGGRRSEVESMLDIPLEQGPPPERAAVADRLVAVPFRQVAERGFEVHDDGTPLVVVDVEVEHEFSVADLVAALDDVPVEFADRGGFETDDDDYADVVERSSATRSARARAPTSSIGRHYRAVVADWDVDARSPSSGGCSSASAAPTGPSSSSPATAS